MALHQQYSHLQMGQMSFLKKQTPHTQHTFEEEEKREDDRDREREEEHHAKKYDI
jgi:hypothetical protein